MACQHGAVIRVQTMFAYPATPELLRIENSPKLKEGMLAVQLSVSGHKIDAWPNEIEQDSSYGLVMGSPGWHHLPLIVPS